MSDIRLGIFCLLFSTPLFLLSLGFFGGQFEGGVTVILFVFVAVGAYVLIRGLKQIIVNFKIKQFGIECYGIINDIQQTERSNNRSGDKVIVHFINPETQSIETLEALTGYDHYKFRLNSYVKCKYYKGKIQIIKKLFKKSIPEEIKECLDPFRAKSDIPDISFSDDREYVFIDGVRYSRVI